jgi:hypothetical protein
MSSGRLLRKARRLRIGGGFLLVLGSAVTGVRGWTITPSHFLNNRLDTVWLGREEP